jgi:hypothetical protein
MTRHWGCLPEDFSQAIQSVRVRCRFSAQFCKPALACCHPEMSFFSGGVIVRQHFLARENGILAHPRLVDRKARLGKGVA